MPVVFLEVPPGIRQETKKDLVKKLNTAIEEVYPIGETLIFFREYPLDMVAENGGLQSENPAILEAVEKTLGA
jgi:hypothetical protein